MGELNPRSRTLVTVGLVLGFCAAVYNVLPKGVFEVRSETVRFAISVVFFPLGLFGVLRFPVVGFPSVIGVMPVLLVLRSVGAIYGRGTDLFYLVVLVVASFRLPQADGGNKVRLRGALFLVLFLIQCVLHTVVSFARDGQASYLIPIQFAAFILMVYVVSKRISREMFALTLYALATAYAAVLAWMLASTPPSIVLATRLGIDLGVNPNLTGMFAVHLICVVFLLLLLRGQKSASAFHLVALLATAVTVFLSGSRVALLQLGMIVLLVFREFRISRPVMAGAVAVAVAGLLASDGSIATRSETVTQSQQYERLSRTLVSDREDLNELAWRLAASSPFFGVGPGNYAKHALDAGMEDFQGQGSYHHNAIAGTAAEFGFVGLALFLLWYVSFLASRAEGRRYGVYVVFFSALAMSSGLSHGLFLDVFDSLPFLFAVLAERFRAPAEETARQRPARQPRGYAAAAPRGPEVHSVR